MIMIQGTRHLWKMASCQAIEHFEMPKKFTTYLNFSWKSKQIFLVSGNLYKVYEFFHKVNL